MSLSSKSKRAAPAKLEKKFPRKRQVLVTDSESALPLPPDLFPNVKIGDDYAAWKTSKGFILVFTKKYRGKIPASALRGKVKPGKGK